MKFESVDDLVKADHPVRVVWRVVETLDLSAFCEPIKARAGSGGRDATDRPASAGGAVAVRLHSRHRFGARVGASVRS
jgi:hypothetical protein